MSVNKGLFTEDEMVLHLDGKKVKDVNNNCRTMLERLFGPLEEESPIECKRTEGSVKPDLILTCKGKTRYVSVKSGRSQSMHQQIIRDFVLYLKDLGVSKHTLMTILYYHYGDGTADGSAPERLSYEELSLALAGRIKEANPELNRSNDFIWKTFKRFVLEGFVENADPADSLYHGDASYGVVITERQMKKFIMRKDWNYLHCLHIGPLLLRPCGRYIGKPITNEKRRQRIEAYWPHVREDIEYIAKRYDD